MKVVAFYSFKGGVGRTMCLLSTAYMLAMRGRKVVVADWDLQAPGLSLMEHMWPADGGLPTRGVLEYLIALRPEHRDRLRVALQSLLLRPRLIADAQSRTISDGQPAMKGDMLVVPAGNLGGGVEAFIDTVKQAQLHNLKQFLADLDAERDPRLVFKVFCEELRAAQISWQGEGLEGEPHYLLVDCRTGITEIGDLLLGDATDFNVIVYGQDKQNLEGLQLVLNASERQPGDLVANTMLIWSGAVAGQEELKREQRQRKRMLVEQVCRPDSLGLPEPFPREFSVPFNPELVYSNVPLVHRVPDSEFTELFRQITDYVEERCLWEDRIIEGVLAPVDPTGRETPEQRRMKLATAPVGSKQRVLRDALTNLELARGLTPLLFNPPPWNLAAVPTPDLVRAWPEGVDAEQQKLFLNLLAYSVSLPAADKRNILERMGSSSVFRATEFLTILTRERHQWLSITGENYWELLRGTLTAGIEWLVLLTEIGSSVRSSVVIGEQDMEPSGLPVNSQTVTIVHDVLRDLVQGNALPQIPFSTHPLFPLLVAESIRASCKQPAALLPKWLQAAKLDPADLRTRLTEHTCRQVATDEFSKEAQAHCWERHGDALDDRSQAATESERAEWLDHAIAAYERSLSLRPDHADTLDALTSTLLRKWRLVEDDAEKSQILEAADHHMQKAMSIQADTACYNFACVLALQGRGDEALSELRQLLAAHPEKRKQAACDEDFASIADRPEFRELIGHDGESK